MAKTLKAEMWDKMQYLFRNFYDRMVHCVQYYDGLIDERVLRNVLVFTTEQVPVLHSSFKSNVIDPYWEVEDYTVNDILTVRESVDLEADVNAFICQSIPVESNVQYKMALFNKDGKSTLCMIVNHMCMDGGDFKYFMKKLAENYNKLLDGDRDLEIKTGSRSYDEVYSKLTPEEEEVARGLYKNISQVKDEHYFPLTPPTPGDVTRICRRKVGKQLFADFRKIGKNLGVTVNDLMLTFYVRSLYEIGMFRDDERLTIPCMVDLRRHIVDGGLHTGLTNHTGFMQCSTAKKGNTINDTLIEVLRSVRKSKEDPYMGLYSLPLLKLAYTIFPYVISEQAIKIGYLNPLIGMSNIGVMDDRALKMGDANIIDGFMTGAVKYKPYMQLALTSLLGDITMTIAIRGNDEDEKIVERFFDMIIANMNEFVRLNRYRVDGSAPPSGVTLPEAAVPDTTAADIDDGTVTEGEERASAAPEDLTAE